MKNPKFVSLQAGNKYIIKLQFMNIPMHKYSPPRQNSQMLGIHIPEVHELIAGAWEAFKKWEHMYLGVPSRVKRTLCKLKRGTLHTKFVKKGACATCAPRFLRPWLMGIPEGESKSMRRSRIFSFLDCGQCSGIVHCSRMAIDSPANDWFLTSAAKQ